MKETQRHIVKPKALRFIGRVSYARIQNEFEKTKPILKTVNSA